MYRIFEKNNFSANECIPGKWLQAITAPGIIQAGLDMPPKGYLYTQAVTFCALFSKNHEKKKTLPDNIF